MSRALETLKTLSTGILPAWKVLLQGIHYIWGVCEEVRVEPGEGRRVGRTLCEDTCHAVGARGDLVESSRAVVDCVHGGHVGEESLR